MKKENYPEMELIEVRIIGRMKKTKEKFELVMDERTFTDWKEKIKK